MKKTNRSQVRQSGKRVQVFKSEANLGSARLRAIPFALAIAFGSSSSFADPAGAVVAAGQAAISSANGITTIQQMSDRAVVNWQSFNVNAGEAVKFVQPSSTAAILNRVTGGSVSNINGLVEGNGRVYLINPNGIVVGANGVVNVNGGFVASTKSLADNAFMSGGALVFTGESTGSIQILGKVQSAQGDVILIAPKIAIEKTGSLIAGQTIKLVAANEVELSNGKFTVKPKVGDAGQLTVEGALEAAKVQLAANNNNLGALAINTTGTIRATGTQTNPDGSVSIIATGEGGNINISGNIRSEKGDGNGGAITVLADNAIRVSGTIDANSTDATKKGGDIIIGRDPVTGKLAKSTDVSGATLLSNKGFVETSGDWLQTTGVHVKANEWLLDPTNINIVGTLTGGATPQLVASSGAGTNTYQPGASAPTSEVLAGDIGIALGNGTNVTIKTTNSGTTGTDKGNITVSSAITAANSSGTDSTLTLSADNGIKVNADIKASGSNKVNVSMTALGSGNDADSGITINKAITTNDGKVTLKGTATSSANGVTLNTGASITAGVGDVEITGVAVSGSAISIANAVAIKGAKVTLDGTSTSTSVAAVNGTGNIDATGKVLVKADSKNAGGYAINTNAIKAAGDIEIDTTSASKHGIALGGAVESTGGGVTIYSDVLTAGSGSAINGSFAITAKNYIKITGKTKGYYSINGLGAIESTGGNVTIDATSTQSRALNLTNTVKAKGSVTLTGTAGNDQGVVFNNGAGITANSYSVKGTSATSYGVNFTGTSNFNSSADSKIEGKNSSGGTGVYAAGATININSGAGKVVVRNQDNSNGAMELRSGTTVNTTGDVTFGRNDQVNNALFLQGLKATATGGKLTFLGSSSTQNGVGFQDYAGAYVDIIGNNGAKILIEGKSTASGYAGVNMKMVATVVHSVTSNGAGGSIDIIGNSTLGRGVGVDIAKVTANDGNVINITGNGSTAGIPAAGEGVYIANAVTANGGGNIKIEGTASGAGVAVFINTNGGMGAITANGVAAGINPAIPAGKVTIKGDANSSIGINNSAAITGGAVEMTGTATGNNAVYSTGAITSTVDDVKITATNNGTSTALSLQGAITANQNVVIEGTNTNATNAAAAVYMNKTATATNGKIDVTASTKGTTAQALQLAAGANLGAKTEVNIKTDTLSVDSGALINAGNGAGLVTIKNDTAGTKIDNDNGNDVGTGVRTLRLSNAELNRINAGNLVIGSSTAGDITVAESTTSNTTNANIALVTGGNINIKNTLAVFSGKTLTLNGAGANSQVTESATGKVIATNLELLGDNATHILINTGNTVETLAAKVKLLDFKNASALTVGQVNGTTGIAADAGISVTTQNDNLTIAKAITNSTSGNVVLGAGVSNNAGVGTGGDVKTTAGATVTNNNANGGTYIYTGSAATTGLLSHLDGSFSELRLSGDMGTTPLAQNADSNIKYAVGTTIAGGAKAQVMFREKVALNTSTIAGATLDKIYGDANTTSVAPDKAALFGEMQAKLKQVNTGEIITRSVDGSNGAGKFKISKAALISDFSGSLDTNAASFSTSDHLKAATHDYGALTSSKYSATLAAGEAKVVVAKKSLSGSIANGKTTYGDTLVAGAVSPLGGVVGVDSVSANGVNIDKSGRTSTSGNLKADTHIGIQGLAGLSGADKDNYSFADVKGDYKVDPLKVSVVAQHTSLNYTGALLIQNQPNHRFINLDKVVVSGLATGTAVGSYLSALNATGDDVNNYDIQLVNDSLVIAYSGINKAPTSPETYTRIAGDVVNLAPVSFAVGVAPATAAGDEVDPNICYAWGQRDGGSVTVHTLLKPSYLGLRNAKTDTQEAMSNGGGSSSHGASPCGHDVATNVASANNI